MKRKEEAGEEPKGPHKDLQRQLARFNSAVANEYKDDWGSLMNYLPTRIQYGEHVFDEVFLAERMRRMQKAGEADALQVRHKRAKTLIQQKYGSKHQRAPKTMEDEAKASLEDRLRYQTLNNLEQSIAKNEQTHRHEALTAEY